MKLWTLPLLLAGASAAGCGDGPQARDPNHPDWEPPWDPKPNVVLVVVDTLRRDHLQPYGYAARPTSPQLLAFAREAITVDDFTCVSSWTMPSMATLFTGLPPSGHGVMRMMEQHSRLREPDTLAAVLRQNGYATACIMTNFLLARRRGVGFERGFELYDDQLATLPDPHQGSTAAQVAERALAWLGQRGGERPYFLVLHFFDPHASYHDHPQYEFADPDYSGWVQGGLNNDVYREHDAGATDADRAQLAAYYDEEIRAVDDAFGRVLAALRRRPDWDDTLVVFTADHGEELAERGYIGHTQTLYQELIALPLIVRLPGSRHGGARSRFPAQTELYGAILEACQVPVPPGRSASLRDLMYAGDAAAGFHEPPPNPWLSGPVADGGSSPAAPAGRAAPKIAVEVDFVPNRSGHSEKFTRKRAVLDGRYKLIWDLKDDRYSLFDLQADPNERDDLIDASEHAARRRALADWMAQHPWWEEQP